MVKKMNWDSVYHVPCGQVNLTNEFAASSAAGVKEYDFSFDENMRNNAELKKMGNLEIEQNAPGMNFYGIFEDEIPWLGKALRIYSELNALCKYHCANYCGVCKIRKKIDQLVDEMLTEGEFSEQCRTPKDCCLQFKEQISRRRNEVSEKKYLPQQYVTLDKFGGKEETRISKPQRKWCRYCGLKHRLGSRFCRSFGQRCSVCQGLNHHPSMCWFRSRAEIPKKLSSASKVFDIPSHENEVTKCSSTNDDDDDDPILKSQKEQVKIADNIPDKANIDDSCKKEIQTQQISDKQNMSPLSEKEVLNFINDNLKRNYESIAKLKNGRGLGNLLENVSGYSVNSNLGGKTLKIF